MSAFGRNLALGGAAGLAASAALAAGAVRLVAVGTIVPPLPFPLAAGLLGVMLGGFSVAEVPMMVYAMRRLMGERPDNRGLVVGLNAVYVFFAAVYAAPVLLLTGSVEWGWGLCGLALLRLASSLALVREPRRAAP